MGIIQSETDAASDTGWEVSRTSHPQPSSADVATDQEAPCACHAYVSTADRKAPRSSHAYTLPNATAADRDTPHIPYTHRFLVDTSIAAGEPKTAAADGIATTCTGGGGDSGRSRLAWRGPGCDSRSYDNSDRCWGDDGDAAIACHTICRACD